MSNKNRIRTPQPKPQAMGTTMSTDTETKMPASQTGGAPTVEAATANAGAVDPAPVPATEPEKKEGQVEEPANTGAAGSVVQQAAQDPVPDLRDPAADDEAPADEDATESVGEAESLIVTKVRYDIKNYIERMAPGKPMNVKEGTANQIGLYNLMVAIINVYGDIDFNASMSIVLDAFEKQANGAFGPRHVFRFMEHIELNKKRIMVFQRLLNMFYVMASPQSRETAKKQINWDVTLSDEISNAGRSRVLAYFNIV